ncbi:uncharacterized serine-rich protein C215.13 isoform X2 [Folsomia candida]|uniref:uncharacterized serine-rich protein C215.13 isoform X2 n=1 Tax=Folsomia candida TaxID=158441 RepID=UPI0016051327|nr:uncharacterized serine-rich protein C215.13 isoform X2 [Folsomia candida]
MPAGHLPSFSHFLPVSHSFYNNKESDRPTPMEQLLISSKSMSKHDASSLLIIDLNNNNSSSTTSLHHHAHSQHDDLLLPLAPSSAQSAAPVELLGWDSSTWSSSEEVTPLTNLLADPLFLPFDTDSNKVDWEPCTSSSDDPFATSHHPSSQGPLSPGEINSHNHHHLICWPSSQDQGQLDQIDQTHSTSDSILLRNALTPHNRKVLLSTYPILSDVTLVSNTALPTSSSSSSSPHCEENSGRNVYYELLVEPEIVIPTHVEELSKSRHHDVGSLSTLTLTGAGGGVIAVGGAVPSSTSTLTISTTTHSNQSLSAKWTYTMTNADGTPKGRKRVKKAAKMVTSSSTTPTSTSNKQQIISSTTTTTTPTITSLLKEGSNHSSSSQSSHSSESTSGGGGVAAAAAAARKERSLHYCTICSKGFKDKYSVNVHVRTHTGEKPFACALCGKAFRQKAHLAKHHQTHAAKAAGGHHGGHGNLNKSKSGLNKGGGGGIIVAGGGGSVLPATT